MKRLKVKIVAQLKVYYCSFTLKNFPEKKAYLRKKKYRLLYHILCQEYRFRKLKFILATSILRPAHGERYLWAHPKEEY